MRRIRTFVGAAILVVAGGGLEIRGASSVAATVTGPILATAPAGDASHDYPFSASAVDLRARDYLEEEYFIQGTANRYETPPQATGRILDGGHAYKTRFVVRRPATPSRFNGTVLVEWNNVTAGRDLDIDWFQVHEHLIRSGYAWVGVSAQRVGVEALKAWNTRRYGSLDLSDGGKLMTDELSYDAFAAVGETIRHPGSVNPLGGLRVERIFATGHSQSAGRLATYLNSVHALAPVFHAVIVHGGGAAIRADLGIKVWKLLAETDVILNQATVRQPDTNNFRSWEVAGDSHVDIQFTNYSRQISQRDGNPIAPGFVPGGRGAATPPSSRATGNVGGCDRPSYSHIPFHYVMAAAIDHLVRWVKDGTLPPSAPPIEVKDAGPPATIVRDARGNALGGIRLSQHEVATAANTGQNSGPGFCRLNGSYEVFDEATLASLYPTHAGYVEKVKQVTERNLRAGYIVGADARATIEEAERSTIGQR